MTSAWSTTLANYMQLQERQVCWVSSTLKKEAFKDLWVSEAERARIHETYMKRDPDLEACTLLIVTASRGREEVKGASNLLIVLTEPNPSHMGAGISALRNLASHLLKTDLRRVLMVCATDKTVKQWTNQSQDLRESTLTQIKWTFVMRLRYATAIREYCGQPLEIKIAKSEADIKALAKLCGTKSKQDFTPIFDNDPVALVYGLEIGDAMATKEASSTNGTTHWTPHLCTKAIPLVAERKKVRGKGSGGGGRAATSKDAKDAGGEGSGGGGGFGSSSLEDRDEKDEELLAGLADMSIEDEDGGGAGGMMDDFADMGQHHESDDDRDGDLDDGEAAYEAAHYGGD